MVQPPPSAGQARLPRSGKLVVLGILTLAVSLSVVKLGQEVFTARRIHARVAALKKELTTLEPGAFRADGHKRLRNLLQERGYVADFVYYRDRALPLLTAEFRKAEEGSLERAACLILLLKIHSPYSRDLLEKALPKVLDPDLRKEVEVYLASTPRRV
jgi:hypothetical protein